MAARSEGRPTKYCVELLGVETRWFLRVVKCSSQFCISEQIIITLLDIGEVVDEEPIDENAEFKSSRSD